VLAATLAVLAVVGLAFAFGYPIGTLLGQRGQISAAEQHLQDLQHAAASLHRQAKALQGDAAVERIARQEYGLVRPGETPYVLVPAAPPTTLPPGSTPTTVP